MSNQPSLEQLEEGLKISARIVAQYGKEYLPVFKRLHQEVEKMKADQSKEDLAIQLAKEYAEKE